MMMMIMMKDRKRSLMTPALEKNYWVFLKKTKRLLLCRSQPESSANCYAAIGEISQAAINLYCSQTDKGASRVRNTDHELRVLLRFLLQLVQILQSKWESCK